MLSLRGKLSRLSLFRGWRASVPGKVSHWQPPPLLPKERVAPSWVQPPTLADLGTKLSLLDLALPCCFSACCVTRWLLAPRHPSARPPAGCSDVVDAARASSAPTGRWWLPERGPSPEVPRSRAAPPSRQRQLFLRHSWQQEGAEPAPGGSDQGFPVGQHGAWAPIPGCPSRAPCSGTGSCFWHLGCIPRDELRDGKGFSHHTQLGSIQPKHGRSRLVPCPRDSSAR